jgi:hypothetical protein
VRQKQGFWDDLQRAVVARRTRKCFSGAGALLEIDPRAADTISIRFRFSNLTIANQGGLLGEDYDFHFLQAFNTHQIQSTGCVVTSSMWLTLTTRTQKRTVSIEAGDKRALNFRPFTFCFCHTDVSHGQAPHGKSVTGVLQFLALVILAGQCTPLGILSGKKNLPLPWLTFAYRLPA